MNIFREIEIAKSEQDLARLEDLLETCFRSSDVSVNPFAPALEFSENVSGDVSDEGGLEGDAAIPAATRQAIETASMQYGVRGLALEAANRAAQAMRELKFDLKTLFGFDGLVIVSEGDSWFQYPIFLKDIIDQLSGDDDKAILSVGAAGDVLSNMVARREYAPAIERTGADVFLLSGSGNDFFDDGNFLKCLKPYAEGASPRELINEEEFSKIFAEVKRNYRAIVDDAISINGSIVILGHAYATPFPREDGPWIGNALDTRGIPYDIGRKLVAEILADFAGYLKELDAEVENYTFVDVRKTVGSHRNSWYDEIHPKNAGFVRIAEQFREAITAAMNARNGTGADILDFTPVSDGEHLNVIDIARVADEYREAPKISAGGTRSSSDLTQLSKSAPASLATAATDEANSVLRELMSRRILDYEARRDSRGRLAIYELPEEDGGGAYEVAGINERYHKEDADHLVTLIRTGRHEDAEDYASEFIATYTDGAVRWCRTSGVEFYLRDCMFNRGPSGAAWIVQHAVGVKTDRVVGPITRKAIAEEENKPKNLLKKLRASREVWERERGRDESSRFWEGLVNRWKNAFAFALSLLTEEGDGAEPLEMVVGAANTLIVDQEVLSGEERSLIDQENDIMSTRNFVLNCEPSRNTEDDWTVESALTANILKTPQYPEAFDLREPWWPVGHQGQTGSCVGWAAADSVFRWHFVRDGRLDVNEELSVRFIWTAAKETDEFNNRPTTFIEPSGTSLKAALDIGRKFGNVRSEVLPLDRDQVYVKSAASFYLAAARLKIAAYVNLRNDSDAWRQWIYEQGPILTRLDVDQHFNNAVSASSVLKNYEKPDRPNGHAVALVGYTKHGFIVRNSWGEAWGHNGFALATDAYAKAAFTETYGVMV